MCSLLLTDLLYLQENYFPDIHYKHLVDNVEILSYSTVSVKLGRRG